MVDPEGLPLWAGGHRPLSRAISCLLWLGLLSFPCSSSDADIALALGNFQGRGDMHLAERGPDPRSTARQQCRSTRVTTRRPAQLDSKERLDSGSARASLPDCGAAGRKGSSPTRRCRAPRRVRESQAWMPRQPRGGSASGRVRFPGPMLGLRGGGMGSPEPEDPGVQMETDEAGFHAAQDPLGLELEELRRKKMEEEQRRHDALHALNAREEHGSSSASDDEDMAQRAPLTIEELRKVDTETDLGSLPTAMGDWRHSISASAPSAEALRVRSRFRAAHSLAQRRAMADKIAAAGKGVPVVCERLHDQIPLPETTKPVRDPPARPRAAPPRRRRLAADRGGRNAL